MAVTAERTPNPNALKFVVGRPVGGPVTYRSADDAPDLGWVGDVFGLGGVRQVFLTGDFVSVTKTDDADWAGLEEAIPPILEAAFA